MKRTRLPAIILSFIFSAVFFAGGVRADIPPFNANGVWDGGSFDNDYTVEINSDAVVSIDANINMNGHILTKTGTGTLLFNNSRALSGSLIISGGTVNIDQSESNIARGEPNFIKIDSGATLQLSQADALQWYGGTPWMIYVDGGTIHSTVTWNHHSMGYITLTGGKITAEDSDRNCYLFDGTIKVEAGLSQITAKNIRFRNSGNLVGGGVIDIVEDGILEILSNIGFQEGGSLVKTGKGLLILSGNHDGSNNEARDEYVQEGTLRRIGGTVTQNVYVGSAEGKAGTYELSGSGELIGASTLIVGLADGGSGTLNVSGGKISMAAGGWTVVGHQGTATGVMNVSGGELSLANVVVGHENNSIGTLNVTGCDSFTVSNDLVIGARHSVNGTVNVSGGKVSVGGGFRLAMGGGTGALNVSGSGEIASDYIAVGENGTGTMTVSGGKVTTSSDIRVGDAGTGTLKVSGGTITANRYIYVGNSGTGILEMDGGTMNTNRLYLGNNSGASGTMNVNGGTIDAGGYIIVGGSGKGTVVQTDGSVKANEIIIADNGGAGSGGSGYTISGTDSLLTANSCLIVGHRDVGTFQQNGGTVTVLGTADGGYSGLFVGRENEGTGAYHLDGGLLVADKITISSLSLMDMTKGGTLWTKNVYGNLTNAGGVLDLVHGNEGALGTTTINGNYTQETGGKLRLELNFDGTDIFKDFLDITKTATLAGTLDLLLTGSDWTLIDSYTEIPILRYGDEIFGGFSISSSSAGFNAFDWDFFTKNDGYGYLSLTPLDDNSSVTPEPGTWMMLMMGIGGLAGMAVYRRKK